MIHAVGVVVPVHDEEALLAGCLHALGLAFAMLDHRVRAHCVVVLDDCSDRSEVIARPFQEAGLCEILHARHHQAGLSRRDGVKRVLERCANLSLDTLWIANTDADSTVPQTWLIDQLALAEQGAEAVLGTVGVADWQEHALDNARMYEAFYNAHGGRESHGHVHGANLGFRADAYLGVGGFSDRSTGEDVELVRALRSANRSIVATRAIEVTTSARRVGRAPHGFAECLRSPERYRGTSSPHAHGEE